MTLTVFIKTHEKEKVNNLEKIFTRLFGILLKRSSNLEVHRITFTNQKRKDK